MAEMGIRAAVEIKATRREKLHRHRDVMWPTEVMNGQWVVQGWKRKSERETERKRDGTAAERVMLCGENKRVWLRRSRWRENDIANTR